MQINIVRRSVILALTATVTIFLDHFAYSETLRHRIDVIDAWVRRPTKTNPEALAFFTIINNTDEPQRLIGVSSPGGEARLSSACCAGRDSAATSRL
jgi:copper(I)-binding protein